MRAACVNGVADLWLCMLAPGPTGPLQFCRYQSIQVQYIIALEMSILERVEYRLPPCPITTCEDFLEVVLWNAKLLDTPDSRDRHAARAGNTRHSTPRSDHNTAPEESCHFLHAC